MEQPAATAAIVLPPTTDIAEAPVPAQVLESAPAPSATPEYMPDDFMDIALGGMNEENWNDFDQSAEEAAAAALTRWTSGMDASEEIENIYGRIGQVADARHTLSAICEEIATQILGADWRHFPGGKDVGKLKDLLEWGDVDLRMFKNILDAIGNLRGDILLWKASAAAHAIPQSDSNSRTTGHSDTGIDRTEINASAVMQALTTASSSERASISRAYKAIPDIPGLAEMTPALPPWEPQPSSVLSGESRFTEGGTRIPSRGSLSPTAAPPPSPSAPRASRSVARTLIEGGRVRA